MSTEPLPPDAAEVHPDGMAESDLLLEAVLLEELTDAMPGASTARVLAVARRMVHRLAAEGLCVTAPVPAPAAPAVEPRRRTLLGGRHR